MQLDLSKYKITGTVILEPIGDSPPLPPPPMPRPRRRFEPPDGGCYWGFHYREWDSTDPRLGDVRPLAERYQDVLTVECGGKKPTIVQRFGLWFGQDGSPVMLENDLAVVRLYNAIAGHAHVPFITWEARTGYGNTTAGYAGITTKSVVSGQLDGYIRAYAQAITAYGRPIFLTPIGAEMNGGYTYNTSPLVNPSLTHHEYVEAWRRVVRIFREEGATNAAWVWVPQVSPPNPADWGHDPRWRDFYPGDDSVDWCGGVWFDNGPVNWIDSYYQFAVDHQKPYCHQSWGVRHGNFTPAQSLKWLEEMFDYFEAHVQVKMVLYFNVNASSLERPGERTTLYNGQVSYRKDVNDSDHRLITDARYRQVFRERIGSSRYLAEIVL